jgi:hypothetical protein
MQYLPPAWKHAHVTSTLKPGKDSGLMSFRNISLLDTIGKLFKKILLTMILREVSRRGFLRNEQFRFGPIHSTALQLARLVERVPGNLEEKKLTGTFFPDVAKAFDIVWFDGLLHKLTVLNFLSYLVKTISSYLHGRMFAVSSKHPHLIVVACGLASVCQRHAYAFPPRRVGSLHGQNDYHSHVPSVSGARQLPGDLSQRHRAVVGRMEDRLRPEEHRDALR